jgi:hypothetical protein
LREQTLPGKNNPSLNWAIAVSLLFHGLILFIPQQSSQTQDHAAGRIDATLAPRPSAPLVARLAPAAVPAEIAPSSPRSNKQLLAIKPSKGQTVHSPPVPRWSMAETEGMNNFLRELDGQAKAGPDLAQRSLAMAHVFGRQQPGQDDGSDKGSEMLERLPNSPPVDPFSLEMYLDGLIKKLNRSAAFVKNDPRSRGMKTATVLVSLNPNGSLQSFKVLNAADQQDEIAFIKSVVERALPFPAFPPDIQQSARSLTMTICILPASSSGGGFGFTRTPDGRRC